MPAGLRLAEGIRRRLRLRVPGHAEPRRRPTTRPRSAGCSRAAAPTASTPACRVTCGARSVPDDYTCVHAAVRAQAAYDNSQAGNRVALLSLWVSDWTPPSQPTQNCSGDVCTTTEGGWNGPNFQINGDLFNFGPVLLQVRSNGGTRAVVDHRHSDRPTAASPARRCMRRRRSATALGFLARPTTTT